MGVINSQISQDFGGLVIKSVPCDSTVYVGAAVRMDATGTAFNGLATTLATSNIIGIVVKKPGTTLCDIRVSGTTSDIFTGLDVTKMYYLSDTIAGEITTVIPTTPTHIMLRLGQPFSDKSFLFMKSTIVVRA